MPITGPIPLPGSPGESFFQGASNTQNILSKILEGRQAQQKLAQTALANQQLNNYRMKELAQTATANTQFNNYRMGQLAISKQTEKRQQDLMPYLIQQYKDVHGGKISENAINAMKAGIAQHTYDQVMGTNQGAQPQSSADEGIQRGNAGNAQAAPGANLQPSAPIAPSSMQAPGMPFEMMNAPAGNVPMADAMEAPGQTQLAQPTPQDINQPPIFPNAMNQGGALAQGGAQMAQGINAPNAVPTAQSPQREVVLRPPTKGLEFQDKLAGTSLGEKLQYHYGKDGSVYTEYPSGKVTYTPSPTGEGQETPDVKRQKDLESKIKLQNAMQENREKLVAEKEGNSIESKVMDPLVKMANAAKKAKEVLDRNKGKNLTGLHNLVGKQTKLLHNKDLNILNTQFGLMQAELAKYVSQRGGIQAVKWASTVKPDILNNDDANIAMVDQVLENTKTDFDSESDRYKSLVKHEPHLKYPKIGEERRSFTNQKTGETKLLTRAEAEALGAKYE